ncbi:hypothetical protein ACVWYU_000104 [Pseudomonas sp. TE12234]
MVVNDDAESLIPRGALRSIASRLAPTVIHRLCQLFQYQRSSPGGRFLKRFMLHMYWLGYART